MKHFLHDKKGESLIESLASILIFTLASVALFTMVTTAVNLNKEAKQQDSHIQEQMLAAESAQVSVGTGKINITVVTPSPSAAETVQVPVEIYGSMEENGLYSYFRP